MWSQERTRIRDRSCYYLKCCEYFVICKSCICCKFADFEVLVTEKNNKYLVFETLSIFFFSRSDVVNLVNLGNVVVVDVED